MSNIRNKAYYRQTLLKAQQESNKENSCMIAKGERENKGGGKFRVKVNPNIPSYRGEKKRVKLVEIERPVGKTGKTVNVYIPVVQQPDMKTIYRF